MPTFQILLHTTGIHMEVGEESSTPCIGFYTSRRANAETSGEAFEKIMKEFDTDPEMRDIFVSAHHHGLRPKTEIEKVFIIPWWKAIFPWKLPGLCFYHADEDL